MRVGRSGWLAAVTTIASAVLVAVAIPAAADDGGGGGSGSDVTAGSGSGSGGGSGDAPSGSDAGSGSGNAVASDAPSPEQLAAAPSADHASGLAIAPHRPGHAIRSALLTVPRVLALVLFEGPRYAAAEIDTYLESRSPNAFGRGTQSSWRFGATADWQTALGPSLGARVGYAFTPTAAVDASVGVFGPRGQSASLAGRFGPFTAAHLRPILDLDAGRSMTRVFSGIGQTRGPRTTYADRRVDASAALLARAGAFSAEPRIRGDISRARDSGDHPLDDSYAGESLIGFAEQTRAVTGSLALVYDTRRVAGGWIPTASPSSGTFVAVYGAYLRGSADRSGDFSTGRLVVEARQLIDLFRGDRVLEIGVRGETITAHAADVPFDRLPALGGPDVMRGLALDELRDRSVASGHVQYSWALGGESRAYLFGELGEAADGPTSWTTAHVVACYGGGILLLSGAATTLRAQLAGSSDGDFAFYLQLGQL